MHRNAGDADLLPVTAKESLITIGGIMQPNFDVASPTLTRSGEKPKAGSMVTRLRNQSEIADIRN